MDIVNLSAMKIVILLMIHLAKYVFQIKKKVKMYMFLIL